MSLSRRDFPNPYTDAPAHAFWRKAVSRVPWNFLDPMVDDHPIINQATRVVSAGSCFAQNMAKFVQSIGYNYYGFLKRICGTNPVSAASRVGEIVLS